MHSYSKLSVHSFSIKKYHLSIAITVTSITFQSRYLSKHTNTEKCLCIFCSGVLFILDCWPPCHSKVSNVDLVHLQIQKIAIWYVMLVYQ